MLAEEPVQVAALIRIEAIRSGGATGRDGRAKLEHQRFGTSYRFRTRDLDSFDLVKGR